MSIVYRIYSNGGDGGQVDYTTPVATTAGLSLTLGPISPSGDYRFTVHAFDAATGLEEMNTQASVRVLLDATAADIGQCPNVPFAPIANPSSGGGCTVAWTYQPAGQAAAPSSFLVYLTAGPIPRLTTPAATVPFLPGVSGYSCPLAGLADGVAYSVAVLARGASGVSSPPAVATVLGDATPPEDVDSLSATSIP